MQSLLALGNELVYRQTSPVMLPAARKRWFLASKKSELRSRAWLNDHFLWRGDRHVGWTRMRRDLISLVATVLVYDVRQSTLRGSKGEKLGGFPPGDFIKCEWNFLGAVWSRSQKVTAGLLSAMRTWLHTTKFIWFMEISLGSLGVK